MKDKEILLRRKNKVIVDSLDTDDKNNLRYVTTINKNIESLGYTLSNDIIEKLAKKDVTYLVKFNNELVSNLKKLVGADVTYSPFYPNFPEEVMNMEESELYINAIKHYINRDLHNSGLEPIFEEPKTPLEKRLPLMEKTDLKIINLGTQKDSDDIMKDLLNSSIGYSEQDRDDIKTYLASNPKFLDSIPSNFENRENYAFIMGMLLDVSGYSKDDKTEQVSKVIESAKKSGLVKNCKSATDVSRIYTVMCGGDASLSTSCSFKPIPRKQRRFLLELMENCENLHEDMSKRPEAFKKMLRYLHVDEFRTKKGNPKYPLTSSAINKIRNSEFARSFDSYLESAMECGDTQETLRLLESKPGVFARKLDEVLRKSNNEEQVLDSFEKIADQINLKLLLSVKQHFKLRGKQKEYRIYTPKSTSGKVFYTPNNLDKIDEDSLRRIDSICEDAIVSKLSKKGKMGKVYISDDIKGFKAPMVLRNLSKESKIITRGSKFPVGEDKDVLRSFIWWKDDSDFDLAVSGYTKDWKQLNEISYCNYKTQYGCHSGDITHQRDNGVEGECEFIDVNLEQAKKSGIKYLVFQVNNFSGKPMDQANCKFGYMERENLMELKRVDRESIYPNTGELFEPLTVKNIMNLSAPSKTAMPMIVDVDTKEIIWADMVMGSKARINNVRGNLTGATAAAYSCVNSETPDLYEILKLNAIARGELTDKKEEADEIFSLEEGTTPFDIEKIVTRFLSEDKDMDCIGNKKEDGLSLNKDSILQDRASQKTQLVQESSGLDKKIKEQEEKLKRVFEVLKSQGINIEELLAGDIFEK